VDAELEARGLACVRGERLVFEGVSFALGPGGALELHGPNGSGKTSLLRLIAGLVRREAGALLWHGAEVADDAEAWRAEVAYVGHQDAVKPLFTLAESLAFWANLAGAGAERVGPALARFGLGRLAEVPARFLSAGQRRRLALARLLAAPRRVWLLDEPGASLDAEAAAALAQVMAEHRAGGGLVIAATHAPLGLEGAQALDLSAGAP
jgi:heme exporter protein A